MAEREIAEEAWTEEQAELYRWRYRQLKDAGADRQLADWLASDRHVDLHQACGLLRECGPAWTAAYYSD